MCEFSTHCPLWSNIMSHCAMALWGHENPPHGLSLVNGQGEHIPHYVLWGMGVCLFVGIVLYLPTLLLYKMVGENPMKKYVLIFFNIFF